MDMLGVWGWYQEGRWLLVDIKRKEKEGRERRK
jgi:hypothetical protein